MSEKKEMKGTFGLLPTLECKRQALNTLTLLSFLLFQLEFPKSVDVEMRETTFFPPKKIAL